MGTWFVSILRTLFIMIDGVIYWAVNMLYRLFIMIAETGIFTPEAIRTFGSRIYVLLGVFMLFKVSFSLINYILNPDTFSDKSKGMGKLLTNFFVVLIGIIAVPYVFQAAYSLQSIILKENVIGSLIMGMNAEVMGNNDYDYVEQGGELMSYTTLSAFIRLNPDVVGDDCADNPVVGEVDDDGHLLFDDDGHRVAALNDSCEGEEAFEVEVDNGGTVGSVLLEAYAQNNIDYFTKTNLINLKSENFDGEEAWIFDYSFLLSSVAGGFLAWILLIFCIDVAVRSVKLGFLQLIAPIPLISYVDPKGQETFKKWLKQCTSTFLSLFIRLVGIYFVLFIITAVVNGSIYNVNTGEGVSGLSGVFIVIFIIFGALMFAKDLPKLISDITGVKLEGGFTLNPMKKLGSSPYAAGAVGLVGGALGGMAANTWALASQIKKKGFVNAMTDGETGFNGVKNFAGNFFSPVAGAGSAAVRGATYGFTSGGKGSLFDSAEKGIRASSQARNLRDKGYGMSDKFGDKLTDIAGVKYATGTTSKLKSEINQLQEKLNNAKRNEQSYSDEFSRQISKTGNLSAKLLRTFNGEVEKWDSKGNPLKYKQVKYIEYGEEEGRKIASNYHVSWDTLDDAGKTAYVKAAANAGLIVQENEFNTISSLYDARNAADIEGRNLQKQINDYNDDMKTFKDRNKK